MHILEGVVQFQQYFILFWKQVKIYLLSENKPRSLNFNTTFNTYLVIFEELHMQYAYEILS